MYWSYTDSTTTGGWDLFFSLMDTNIFFHSMKDNYKYTHLADRIRKDVRHLCDDACVVDVNAFDYLVNVHQQKLYGLGGLTINNSIGKKF